MTRLLGIIGLAALALAGGAAQAQDRQIRLGQSLNLTESALEVLSDSLEVDQTSGASVFSGNVMVTQGELRLSAGSIRVEYAPRGSEGGERIDRLIAEGGVTLATPDEAAEAERAVYALGAQTLEMQGAVMLLQGDNMLSGERLLINLRDGTGQISGRVRTIIRLD